MSEDRKQLGAADAENLRDLFAHMRAQPAPAARNNATREIIEDLSEQISGLISQGYSVQEIADEMHHRVPILSSATYKGYLYKIRKIKRKKTNKKNEQKGCDTDGKENRENENEKIVEMVEHNSAKERKLIGENAKDFSPQSLVKVGA